MSGKQIASPMNHVLAPPLLLQGSDDEIASATDVSDDGENDIDSVKYLITLQKIRKEAHKASQANFKRQFATVSAEFRGHASAVVEEMDAYINKMELDALNVHDSDGIGSKQTIVSAVLEWKAQLSKANEARVIDVNDILDIRREDEVNQVSRLIEATASKRAQAHRQLLRKVKIELERLCEEEKVVTDAKALVKRYKKLLRR